MHITNSQSNAPSIPQKKGTMQTKNRVTYLVSSPARVSKDIDDWAPAAQTSVEPYTMALLFYNSYRIRHDCTHSHVQRTTDLGSDLRSGSISNAVEEVIVEGGRLCAGKTRCRVVKVQTSKQTKKKKKKKKKAVSYKS